MGRRRIRITVCNVPIQLNEEVLAAYLCEYGDIEDITKAKSNNGTAHGDYNFTMCLYRGGLTAIPHTLEYESQVMIVVVEGRKPQCWNCKQMGHFSKSCPQNHQNNTTDNNSNNNNSDHSDNSSSSSSSDYGDQKNYNNSIKRKWAPRVV